MDAPVMHPERVMFRDYGITKSELCAHDQSVAPTR